MFSFSFFPKLYRLNPTINDKNKKLSCEVHILDFDEKIYKKEIEIQFLDFFRLEKNYSIG